MTTHRIVGSGITQEVTPTRQQHMADRLDQDATYAHKARTHLWILLLSYRANDAMLDSLDDPDTLADMTLLDADSMATPPVVACYVCEAAYEPRLRLRRCPGEPQ